MAREVAAITGKKLIDPVKPRDLGGSTAIHIDIESYELSPRYSALVFENAGIGIVALHADAVAQDRATGCFAGGVDGDNSETD